MTRLIASVSLAIFEYPLCSSQMSLAIMWDVLLEEDQSGGVLVHLAKVSGAVCGGCRLPIGIDKAV